jgi:cytochrome c oxidase subunit IV
MANNTTHIIEYKFLSKILLILLSLTILTILVATLELGKLTLTVALLIACVKSYIVMFNFMHLKYESLLLRILVGSVYLLFALIVAITFIDYAFR